MNRRQFILGTTITSGILLLPKKILGQPLDVLVSPGTIDSTRAKEILRITIEQIDYIYDNPQNSTKYQEAESALNFVIEKCIDPEMRYRAHYEMARLIFTQEKTGISETFDYLEKCVLEYSEQEKKFGLVKEKLCKKSDQLAEMKSLIGTSRCYEIGKKIGTSNTTIFQRILNKNPEPLDTEHLKLNLQKVLNRNLGELSLADALRKTFLPDEINCYIDQSNISRSMIGIRFNYPYYSLANQQSFKILIGNDKIVFPTMNPNTKAEIFYTKGKPIEISHLVKWRLKEQTRDILRDLENIGIKSVGEIDIENLKYDYLGAKSKSIYGVVEEIMLKPGKTIEDLLRAGNVDPFNWVFGSNRNSQSSW